MTNQEITRRLLNRIDNNPSTSQKKLAEEIGISVGMINWHVKRCVGKGLIKLKEAPVHRYLYYLTPKGFVEKAQLTANYLQLGFDVLRIGREHYGDLLQKCSNHGWKNIVLVGNTELTELALLVANRFDDLSIYGIVDREAACKESYGIKIVNSPCHLFEQGSKQQIDAVVACHYLASIGEAMDQELILQEFGLDPSRFLIPGFLK